MLVNSRVYTSLLFLISSRYTFSMLMNSVNFCLEHIQCRKNNSLNFLVPKTSEKTSRRVCLDVRKCEEKYLKDNLCLSESCMLVKQACAGRNPHSLKSMKTVLPVCLETTWDLKNTLSGKPDEKRLKLCCLWSSKLSSNTLYFLGASLSKNKSKNIARIV